MNEFVVDALLALYRLFLLASVFVACCEHWLNSAFFTFVVVEGFCWRAKVFLFFLMGQRGGSREG